MEDKNKERFYENYESIRDFVINGKDLTKKEEVLALCDLLLNTKHLEISKATRKKKRVYKTALRRKRCRVESQKRSNQNGKREFTNICPHLVTCSFGRWRIP